MSKTILYVRTTVRSSPGAILTGAGDVARAIAHVPGLLWKVWLVDEPAAEFGGVYLFGSRAQAQAYVGGPVLQHLGQDPRVAHVEHRLWDTHALSALTRAPEVASAQKEVA